MALTGVHIVCSRVAVRAGASLPIYADWSETLNSPGTTSNAAIDGNSLLTLSAAVDAFVAIGKAPDAGQAVGSGQSARYFIRAGADLPLYCTSGDKVAWAAA